MNHNFILCTDGYKASHWNQYPVNTQYIYSYFESRSGSKYSEILFFGLQYYLKRYLEGKVFNRGDIEEARTFYQEYFGSDDVFNYRGWLSLLDKYGGSLPLRIMAAPEFQVYPSNNILFSVENTDPEFPWLVGHIESVLSKVWYPTTVATQSHYLKKLISKYLQLSGNLAGIDFKLHDFGHRGVSSEESACLGAAAHLLSFKGTGTISGMRLLQQYYNFPNTARSIPAMEHSTVTSWGKDNELEAYRNMLLQYPNNMIAIVADSYDIYNACSNLFGEQLYNRIINRDQPLVIRPDSGDPLVIIPDILNILANKFGSSYNDKGYRVLNHVRIIQGDGVNPQTIEDILQKITDLGWSADNIAFGSGGALLQKLDRDTCKFAFKCSAIFKDNSWYDVYKSPITDLGKKSKRGRLTLIKDNDKYKTINHQNLLLDNTREVMRCVFLNGKVT